MVRSLSKRIQRRRLVSPKQAKEGAFAMTQILESTTCSTPARRRALPAAPVLIRVPTMTLSATNGRGPVRRRRVRREIRIAGYWALALLPPAVACATWGGSRAPMLLAVRSPDQQVEAGASPTDEALQRISLSIAPMDSSASRFEPLGSVFLSGELLPTDAAGELVHGGY